MPYHPTTDKPASTKLSIKIDAAATGYQKDVRATANVLPSPIATSPTHQQAITNLLKYARDDNFADQSGGSADVGTVQTPQSAAGYVTEKRSKKKSVRSTPLEILKSASAGTNSQFYSGLIEFIPGKLYFDSPRLPYTNVPSDALVISIDNEFQYTKFYLDFGPPNIVQILKFTKFVQERLDANPFRVLVLACSNTADKCTNAAFLVCCYMVLKQGQKPLEATRPLQDSTRNIILNIAPYRDAGYGAATYWITIYDCVNALYNGVFKYKLLDLKRFDAEEYEFYERVENGDLNWVVPNYFVALATPQDEPPAHLVRYHDEVKAGNIVPLKPPSKRFKPLIDLDNLVPYLKNNMNVKALVRLNNKLYDRQRVVKGGLAHYELYFPDGSVPPWDTIVKSFMMLCDSHLSPYPYHEGNGHGALAVHCKAGLGRTGSLICCWMIKTLGLSARECISWCRLMRPGSVVGPQQNWLESVEHKLLKWGEEQRTSLAIHHSLSEEKMLLNSGDSNLDLTVNNGSDAVADQTFMGMHVPVQPRKGKKTDGSSGGEESSSDMDWNPDMSLSRATTASANSSTDDISRKSNKRKNTTGRPALLSVE